MIARWGFACGLAVGAAVLCGHGVAAAAPDTESRSSSTESASVHVGSARVQGAPHRTSRPAPAAAAATPVTSRRTALAAPALAAPALAAPTAPAAPTVSVDLPPMPVSKTRAYTVSQPAITDAATAYVATSSLDILASRPLTRDQVRVEMGNLAASGYFGGIWLRDNLRAGQTQPAQPVGAGSQTGGVISALGLRMFSQLVAGLSMASKVPLISNIEAHASVPVLLSLYGYNKGYLEYLLDNPPAGVPSMRDTLTCKGFLDCNSSLVNLEIANRYDGALVDLAHPPTLRWAEMKLWSSALELTTGAGRFVWKIIGAGGFSPESYTSLVDLSSAYLMISKAATLASMQSYADCDRELASAALLLQGGLWMWSGAYFSGLASNAPRGTIPTIVLGNSAVRPLG